MSAAPLRARLYNWELAHVAHRTDQDAAFYAELACGPTLELACGTGRLTAHLLGTGQPIVGLDLDTDMLAAARSRTRALTANRAQFVQADMTRFHFASCPFALVAIPYNSLQLLVTLDAQVGCLTNAAAVLRRADGKLALEVSTFGAGGPVETEKLAEAEGIELWAGLEVDGQLVRYRKQFRGSVRLEDEVTLRDYADGEFEQVLAAGGFAVVTTRPFRRGQLVVASPLR